MEALCIHLRILRRRNGSFSSGDLALLCVFLGLLGRHVGVRLRLEIRELGYSVGLRGTNCGDGASKVIQDDLQQAQDALGSICLAKVVARPGRLRGEIANGVAFAISVGGYILEQGRPVELLEHLDCFRHGRSARLGVCDRHFVVLFLGSAQLCGFVECLGKARNLLAQSSDFLQQLGLFGFFFGDLRRLRFHGNLLCVAIADGLRHLRVAEALLGGLIHGLRFELCDEVLDQAADLDKMVLLKRGFCSQGREPGAVQLARDSVQHPQDIVDSHSV
mmetsp:Transcript_78071/g.181099  ORF Transcript_78071/g.181099 Transcript_78071/m.181099 type:complete len:276 (-) Transcript_78071:1209-2036(-)